MILYHKSTFMSPVFCLFSLKIFFPHFAQLYIFYTAFFKSKIVTSMCNLNNAISVLVINQICLFFLYIYLYTRHQKPTLQYKSPRFADNNITVGFCIWESIARPQNSEEKNARPWTSSYTQGNKKNHAHP